MSPIESTGWQGWSRVFGGLSNTDLEAPALLEEAQLDDESRPAEGVFPLGELEPDDGWSWL